jgi:hypothetical protein
MCKDRRVIARAPHRFSQQNPKTQVPHERICPPQVVDNSGRFPDGKKPHEQVMCSKCSPATTWVPEQAKPPHPIMTMVSWNPPCFVGLDPAGLAQVGAALNS